MTKKSDVVLNERVDKDLFTGDIKPELVNEDGRVLVSSHYSDISELAMAAASATTSNVQARAVPMDEAEADRIVSTGESWLAAHRHVVDALPPRTVVAVNVENAQYVTGASGLEAMERFAATFGSEAKAWIHRVGGPISLGSGLWALKSGA